MSEFTMTLSEVNAIKDIVNKNGKGIRKSKPKVDKSDATGRAAYVWRMVMFTVSKNPVHHCIPVCADMDLCDSDWANRKDVIKTLDHIVEAFIQSVSKSEWYGVRRWCRAMGV